MNLGNVVKVTDDPASGSTNTKIFYSYDVLGSITTETNPDSIPNFFRFKGIQHALYDEELELVYAGGFYRPDLGTGMTGGSITNPTSSTSTSSIAKLTTPSLQNLSHSAIAMTKKGEMGDVKKAVTQGEIERRWFYSSSGTSGSDKKTTKWYRSGDDFRTSNVKPEGVHCYFEYKAMYDEFGLLTSDAKKAVGEIHYYRCINYTGKGDKFYHVSVSGKDDNVVGCSSCKDNSSPIDENSGLPIHKGDVTGKTGNINPDDIGAGSIEAMPMPGMGTNSTQDDDHWRGGRTRNRLIAKANFYNSLYKTYAKGGYRYPDGLFLFPFFGDYWFSPSILWWYASYITDVAVRIIDSLREVLDLWLWEFDYKDIELVAGILHKFNIEHDSIIAAEVLQIEAMAYVKSELFKIGYLPVSPWIEGLK